MLKVKRFGASQGLSHNGAWTTLVFVYTYVGSLGKKKEEKKGPGSRTIFQVIIVCFKMEPSLQRVKAAIPISEFCGKGSRKIPKWMESNSRYDGDYTLGGSLALQTDFKE